MRCGTPAYMAPESSRPVRSIARTDVYALATVAFEMLTGRAAVRREYVQRHDVPKTRNRQAPSLTRLGSMLRRSARTRGCARTRPRSGAALSDHGRVRRCARARGVLSVPRTERGRCEHAAGGGACQGWCAFGRESDARGCSKLEFRRYSGRLGEPSVRAHRTPRGLALRARGRRAHPVAVS